MKRTLLDMTQSILSSLNSDEVNSIGDTTESLQVADIIKQTWINIAGRVHSPVNRRLFQLESSTEGDLPVIMYVPEDITSIEWIKYYNESSSAYYVSNHIHDLNLDITSTSGTVNTAPNYSDIIILSNSEFIDMVNKLNLEEPDVESFKLNDIQFRYKSAKQPEFCTILNNKTVVFDSHDILLDTILQKSKTSCSGEASPVFVLSDDYIPDLDDSLFPLLFNEAKSLAFIELKQLPHVKAEQESKRQWNSVQRNKYVNKKPTYFNELPDLGRHGPWHGR